MKVYDIVVLGGGLVGLTIANFWSQKGISVAVIEKNQPDLTWNNKQFDLRCSAISRASQKIFTEIGIWSEIELTRISPYRRMVVWDALGFGEIAFDASEVFEPDLGHIIENRVMVKALWEKVRVDSNVDFFIANPPVALEVNSDAALLTLVEGTKLSAKLIVGADGSQSWVREASGITITEQDYHQEALIAAVMTEHPHQETAWQRFLSEGPLAFLPLSSVNMSSIVWTAGKKLIERLLRLEDAQFCQELAHHFDYRLGKVISVTARKSFPLKRLHAKQYVAERIALIGDAAHVLHPLAGQGANLGLYAAKRLAEIVIEALENNVDIGSYLILRKYEREQKSRAMTMIMFTEALHKMFSSQDSGTIGIRGMGLNFINRAKVIKKKLILEAMGL